MLEIRSAQPQHARPLAEFAERSFRETFERDNTAEDMDLYTAETFGEERQLREILDPAMRVVLAFEHGELIGFYYLRDGHPDPAVDGPRPIELLRLYVDSRWHGKQLAHRLLQDAIDWSRQQGFATFWLGVWERNRRAQAFYKKWGFTEVGSHIFQLGKDPQRDLVYSRSI